MSPAVSTATASAAAAIAPNARRRVTTQQHAQRAEVEQRRLFQLGLDGSRSRRRRSRRPTATPPSRARTRRRAADQNRLPADRLSAAGVAKCPQPGGCMQAEGDERRQDDHGQKQPAARMRRCEKGRMPARCPAAARSPRSRARAWYSREPDAAGRRSAPIRGRIVGTSRAVERRARPWQRASRCRQTPAWPRAPSRAPASPRPPQGRAQRTRPPERAQNPAQSRNPAARMRDAVFSYASVTHSTILSGSGEYSSSIEIAASGISSFLIASR